jgi:hypothetical protein
VIDVLFFARPEEPRKRMTDIRRVLENAMEIGGKIPGRQEYTVEYRFAEMFPSPPSIGAMWSSFSINLYRKRHRRHGGDGRLGREHNDAGR